MAIVGLTEIDGGLVNVKNNKTREEVTMTREQSLVMFSDMIKKN